MTKFLQLSAGQSGRGAIAAIVASFLALPGALGNDSSASLDAGGLKLTYNPDIRMDSEDLFLSRNEVRIVYRFHNVSAHDVNTLVAFPLPVMEIGEAGNYVLKSTDPINIVDFQVSVDGRRVEPLVEVKATRFGVDVTALLQRHGISLTKLAGSAEGRDALLERLDNLSDDARRDLERYGVIDWNTSFGAGNKPHANTHWDAHISFYWFQTFPAGRTIEVTHRYKPVPRHFFFMRDDLESTETKKTYCFDDAFISDAAGKIRQSSMELLKGYELKYVLTTAGNWFGPIGKFQLTVEQPSPDGLVSLCSEGIKRTSPTTLVFSKDNYAPSEDLKVLFLEQLEKAD